MTTGRRRFLATASGAMGAAAAVAVADGAGVIAQPKDVHGLDPPSTFPRAPRCDWPRSSRT
jgi:hypothetical protein